LIFISQYFPFFLHKNMKILSFTKYILLGKDQRMVMGDYYLFFFFEKKKLYLFPYMINIQSPSLNGMEVLKKIKKIKIK